ncbi:MAG TPA: tetratricopeptide repeat protein [Terriglobales bacterium]|nr:tetratricopeptide repeat protein [Terriglobales bacterium]
MHIPHYVKADCGDRWSLLVIGTAILLALVPASALAQNAMPEQGPGKIAGTVKNPAGVPITSATIILRQTGAAKVSTTTTNSQGSFEFSKLDAGVYVITAQKDGWQSSVVQSIAMRTGESKRVDLILQGIRENSNESSHDLKPAVDAAVSMQFSDSPSFTVAGVTDYSGAGGHGSETGLRTSEALTRETLVLKAPTSRASTPPDQHELELEREHLRKMIASGDKAELHKQLADIEEQLHDPVGAVRDYEQATLLEPIEDNYFAWGTELLLHRAAEPAAEVFKKGAGAHPKSARMLAGLGAALYAAGSQEEAARRFCEASDLDPARAEIYEFLGEMEKTTTSSMPACVQQKLSRFARNEPHNARANFNYALALWKQNRESPNASSFQEATQLLEKAIVIDPDLAEAHLLLGTLQAEQGDIMTAIHSYRTAITVAPNLAEAHYRLGLAYRRVGDLAKAQQEFQKYEQVQATQTAAIEHDRRQLRQFLIVMKEQPSVAH